MTATAFCMSKRVICAWQLRARVGERAVRTLGRACACTSSEEANHLLVSTIIVEQPTYMQQESVALRACALACVEERGFC